MNNYSYTTKDSPAWRLFTKVSFGIAAAMQAGGILAGEAGTEGIFPLARTPSGDLGVKGTGGTVVNINNNGPNLQVTRQDEYMVSDQRIIDVFVSAAETDPGLRRTVKNAAR